MASTDSDASDSGSKLEQRCTSQPPFDELAQEADIILRSSDLVEFHFSKSVLAYSSPVFRNLLTDGQPVETGLEGRSVVPLPDHSSDIRLLLLLLRPLHNIPIINKIQDLIKLQRIVDKYCLTNASAPLYRLALGAGKLVSDRPSVELFATAVHIQNAPLAKLAAKRMLQIPLHKLLGNRAYDVVLGDAPARYINQLVRYHQECGEKARTIWKRQLPDISWMSSSLRNVFFTNNGNLRPSMYAVKYAEATNASRRAYVDSVVKDFYDAVYQALEICPCAKTVRAAQTEITAMGQALVNQSPAVATVVDIMQLVEETCNEVDRRIATVVFDIEF